MNPTIIIQARTGSKRLPNKVLANLGDKNVLYYVIKRCQLSKSINKIVIATSNHQKDDAIESLALTMNTSVFRGKENDVLSRFMLTATKYNADPIIRINADSPLIDSIVIDEIYESYKNNNYDYVSIVGYPRGVCAEIFSFSSLKKSFENTQINDTRYREHVTTFIIDNPNLFNIKHLEAPKELNDPDLRLCVDEIRDLEVVRIICNHFHPRVDFKLNEILKFLDENSKVKEINQHVKQKEL